MVEAEYQGAPSDTRRSNDANSCVEEEADMAVEVG